MNSDKNDKTKPDQKNPDVFTPEPPQVMNPSEQPKKNADDKTSGTKKKEKKTKVR